MKNVHALQENIFITSDDEIKYGDWMIRDNEQPIKSKKVFFWDLKDGYYKIILTTDQDLIKDGIQSIDDEFLEWFVKNPSCEEVEVEKLEGRYVDYSGNVHIPINYKIIIPKEEPKQETLEEAAKNYIYKPQNNDYGDYNSFIAGAKWQQERSYSEEDMRECWMACLGFNKPEKFNSRVKFEEWFETFSK